MFQTKTIEEELESLEYMGSKGVNFLLLKPVEQGSTSLGTYVILDLNYTKSDFIYSSKALKITFNLTLERIS